MNTASLSVDDISSHNRKPLLVYPLIVIPFLCALFWTLDGGDGITANQSGSTAGGFNVVIPNAGNSDLQQRSIETPAYGRAEGQVLSDFTDAKKVTVVNGLREMPTDAAPKDSLFPAKYSGQSNRAYEPSYTPAFGIGSTRAEGRVKGRKKGSVPTYQYNPPKPYYVGTNQTDQQLESQLSTYQQSRSVASTSPSPIPTGLPPVAETTAPVRIVEPGTASRLADGTPTASPFNTAEVGTLRREGQHTVLQSSGNNKRAVTTMIPAVIHDNQSVRPGQTIKLRLTKAINVDGINVPANTILHATCHPDGDRLRLIVRSLQFNSQLVPLDLEAVDLDGGTGVNAPGLSDQLGGQIKSSAMQGVNIPTGSGLLNTVINSARFGAASAVRQPMIHLKGGYNIYLKSI